MYLGMCHCDGYVVWNRVWKSGSFGLKNKVSFTVKLISGIKIEFLENRESGEG